MKKVGMVVAVEVQAVVKKYKNDLKKIPVRGYEVYSLTFDNKELYIVNTGAGEIRTAAAVQLLIDRFEVEMIVNFGVVGALREELCVAHTCVVKRAVHYDMDTSSADNTEVGRYLEYEDIYLPTTAEYVDLCSKLYPELAVVTCASADKFVGDEKRKIELREKFNADICDMESAAIILICDRNNIPNLLIKTISDSITGGAEEFYQCAEDAADICLDMIDKIMTEL